MTEKRIVRYANEEELQQLHNEALEIILRLRFWTKYHNEHGGRQALTRKVLWQTKADCLLRRYGITEIDNVRSVQIVVEDKTADKK